MKGYKNLNGQTAPAVFTVQGVPFYETELTAEEEKAVLDGDLHNQYFILYEWEWECHADNDGGVDSFQFGEKEFPLAPENSILQDGRVIGFFFKKRVFLLQGGGSVFGAGANESVGGWGDISSDSSYTLKQKK